MIICFIFHILPILILSIPFLLEVLFEDFFNLIYLREEGMIEIINAIILAFSLIYISRCIRHTSKYSYLKLYFYLLFFFVFFILGEEISWGQTYLRSTIETPETWKKLNYQGEINLHNLEVIRGIPNLIKTILCAVLFVLGFFIPLFQRFGSTKINFKYKEILPNNANFISAITLFIAAVLPNLYMLIFNSKIGYIKYITHEEVECLIAVFILNYSISISQRLDIKTAS